MTNGVLPEKHHKKKIQRKNSTKARRRKQKRQEDRIVYVLKELGYDGNLQSLTPETSIKVVDKTRLYSLHKRYDISALKICMEKSLFDGQAATLVAGFVKEFNHEKKSYSF